MPFIEGLGNIVSVDRRESIKWDGNTYNMVLSYNPSKDQFPLYLPQDYTYKSPKPPKDSDSWSRIKKSGTIKMTPLSRSSVSHTFNPVAVPEFYVQWFGIGPNSSGDYFGPISEVASCDRFYVYRSNTGSLPFSSLDYESGSFDLDGELNSLRSRVVADNLQTYDILTELSEAKETASSIMRLIQAARSPLQSFIDYRKSLLKRSGKIDPKKLDKALSDKWMEYRYTLMPIIYSIKDLAKLLEESNNVFKTSRATRHFTVRRGQYKDPSKNGLHLYTEEEIQYRLSCIGKCSYDPSNLKLRFFDQIGINPFQTAWEMIPYSFVIDWIANIGDWVLAHTASLADISQQRVFCQSVKVKKVTKVHLCAKTSYDVSWAVKPGVVEKVFNQQVNVDDVLYTSTTESYDRELFVPSDVSLQLDIFLNWKRAVDAFVLGKRPVIKALRSLK